MDAKRTPQSAEGVVTGLARRAHRERHARGSVLTRAVTVRLAAHGDEGSLERLAELDSALPPTGPALVAEFGGELVAALSLDDGRAIANPFRHTREVVRELQCQAAELSRSPSRSRHAVRARYVDRTSAVSAG
jgi:hypothetical protein